MMYFIDDIKTYVNVNQKGRALQIFVQQFDHHLIAEECSLDALKCEIEHEIQKQNEKYPRSRPVRLDAIEVRKGGQWTILVEEDPNSVVCIISYQKVMGYYALADKIGQFKQIS